MSLFDAADLRPMRKLARNALDVQNACNLSGVVHSFARDISRLRQLLPDAGTAEINRHPVCYLYSVQIGHLTGASIIADGDYAGATKECERLAAIEE